MHRGFRFRLYPTATQAETLGQWIGVTRLVYNLALEQRRDFWRQYRTATGKVLAWTQQSREVTDLRREYDFINAVPRGCLEQALRDLDKAFGAFFSRGAGYPSWRIAGVHDAIRLQGRDVQVRAVNRRWAEVRVPSLGWVKFRRSRQIAGDVMNITISRTNEWAVSFASDIGEAPASNDLPSVGVDRGVANTISLSSGEHLSAPSLQALDRRTLKAQRVLARRKRGSRRYAKQRGVISRLRAKGARVRKHWAHLTTTDIARRFGVVALEDLNIKAMTASAGGTVEEPGRNVRQKAGLNRSILNQAWGQLGEMLEYKLEAAGGRLIYVPSAYTSQTCQACGVIDAKNRESQSVFACVHCGHRDHADTNAALEIRRRSTALLLAEGGQLGRPVEPRTLAA